MIRWSELFPDESDLILRKFYKDAGQFTLAAAAGADYFRVSMVGVGGQGEHPGGSGAFSHRKAKTYPGEVFQIQVGQCGTGMTAGDSWMRRSATGEMVCYADRGRGTGGVQGSAANCIGDIRRSGVASVSSGSDAGDMARLGFGGRYGVSRTRAPGPGGGGQAGNFPALVLIPAGQGMVAVEWYGGDPGDGY